MFKRGITMIICVITLFCLCVGSAAAEGIIPEGIPEVFPVSTDQSTIANAKPAPKECFTEYASDNGLEGLVCYMIGKVIEIKDIETDQAPIHSFVLQTEYGYVNVHDTYSYMMELYSESETASVAEPESDYSFPTEGDFVKIIGIYSGYSEKEKMPSFHYGTPVALMSAYHPEVAKPEPTPAVERLTSGQSNALRKANQYLKIMPFSYIGLIEQLEHDAFDHDDAVYAADHCKADWNEQAAKKAEKYLDIMGFSRDGLISQLQHDGFTYDQAAYGADQNGL